MFVTARSRRRRSTKNSYPRIKIGPQESPYPFNCVEKGLPFAYRCSKCGFFASEDEPDWVKVDLRSPGDTTIPGGNPYDLCPVDEGPDHAVLLSPSGDSQRYRGTYSTGDEEITACIPWVVRRNRKGGRSWGPVIKESDLLLELHLQRYLKVNGPGPRLTLEPIREAPGLPVGPLGKVGGCYLMRVGMRHLVSDWEHRAVRLSREVQGERPGILAMDIARVMDPALSTMWADRERVLFVPVNLSFSLDRQWRALQPQINAIAEYAYRFTREKRPREKRYVFRDIFIYLSVRLNGRSVSAVAREVFPHEERVSREKKVRAIVSAVARAAARARPLGSATGNPGAQD